MNRQHVLDIFTRFMSHGRRTPHAKHDYKAAPNIASSLMNNLPAVWHRSGDCRNPIHKLGPVYDVCIVEHPFLEGHHYELGIWEVGLDHSSNVLSVAQIQCSINL